MGDYSSVISIARDPIAGCLDVIQSDTNYKAMVEHLWIRMSTVNTKTGTICKMILDQCELIKGDRREFAINEMQYEIRKAINGNANLFVFLGNEDTLLKKRVSYQFKNHLSNMALDWFNQVKEFRKERAI